MDFSSDLVSFSLLFQCKRFGLEGNEMFLVAGADRRVSVWAADWSKEKCDLLDWLSFPAPPSSEVRLLVLFLLLLIFKETQNN